ncbi:hypothetical protein V8073_005204 [Vibrio parahaemolyticus]|uniref:hypothetical protein n=1 Tax=Vibrio parahaemolyticus TaxID=670 RepID=UPI0015DD1A3B|nr:hypothetical protein [Vibrio parahaemolyticus]QLK48418.1 hypothetical protein DR996_25915 [Vibrio owensii]MBE4070201.1 hypothetical protein [Vibrio parahaemolyticus]WCZ04264.1 hypothetical protein GSS61_24615 [Vibrio parahaemolyticus]HBC3428494.1 hypothetical protein [Vibrio parahaemolyticus]HBC3857184.1 hypothetical protein [Vibrio parahaemolyticus]
MAKLTKGEIQGIRLIADVFVLNDLLKNFFAKDADMKDHVEELSKSVKKACPKFELAQQELQNQIQEVRNVWISELEKKGNCND